MPAWLDPLFTWLTGLAYSGHWPRHRAQVFRTLTPFGMLYVGLLLGVAAIAFGGVMGCLLLPLTWTLAVAGARDLQLTIYHGCAHQNVLSKAWSARLGRLIATILLIERFDSYEKRHRRDHHGRHLLSTLADPTVDFLLDIVGVIPGASVADNRRRILLALVSPRVHGRILWRRLRSQFGRAASWGNRVATASALLAMGAGALLAGGWIAFILAVLVPLVWSYQAAQILRLVVEHRWPSGAGEQGNRTLAAHDELTVSVRCAVPPPSAWTFSSGARFTVATLFNAWIRFVVLPGDSGPNHHWHHGEPRGDWVNHVAASARWEEKRRQKGLPPTLEAWGFVAAFNATLASFAAASPESLSAPSGTVLAN